MTIRARDNESSNKVPNLEAGRFSYRVMSLVLELLGHWAIRFTTELVYLVNQTFQST